MPAARGVGAAPPETRTESIFGVRLDYNARHSAGGENSPIAHLPAFTAIAPFSGCARIPRKERKGDVQVDTGDTGIGKRRTSPERGRRSTSHREEIPPSPGGINPPALAGANLSRSETNRKDRAVNFDKIPNNSINIDKFTGFFDKKRARENSVRDCNIVTYKIYLSGGDSDMTAKILHAPHLP